MRKIALVSEHASPLAPPGSIDSGGQNVYVAQVARHLARAGHRVDVFTRRDAKEQPSIVEWQDKVRVIHIPAGPACFVEKEQLLPYMGGFAEVVGRFIRRYGIDYDLMHANFFMSGMVAQNIKRKFGIPYVVTFHALGQVRRLCQGSADGFPEQRLEIERALMHDADRIIAECPQDRLDMETLYGAPSERIDIVPCGFDPEELGPAQQVARQRIGIDAREFVVLQLGRMVPRKGVDNVIRGVALLRERHDIRARLLVVGGNAECIDADSTPELARLANLAHELGVADQVRFTGQRSRSQLRYYYSAADVFVTTPWYEPFGITPLEAMACATPVIGAAVGGIKSTVLDGETGFLVPPKDPHALAERLARLYHDPTLALRMGRAGLRRVHRLYTWESVAARLAQVYEAVLDESAALTDPMLLRAGGRHASAMTSQPTELQWTM